MPNKIHTDTLSPLTDGTDIVAGSSVRYRQYYNHAQMDLNDQSRVTSHLINNNAVENNMCAVNLIDMSMSKLPHSGNVFRPFDQKHSESCVAASISYGVMILAVLSGLCTPESHADVPSVNYTYHMMRKMECEQNGQCSCGPGCGDVCNADCGSLVSIGLDVFEKGVPPSLVWPEDKPDDRTLVKQLKKDPWLGSTFVYVLETFRPVEIDPDAVKKVIIDGYPVVLNLKIWSNQRPFFKVSSLSRMSDNMSHNHNVFDDAFRLPVADGPDPENYGHCVLVVGVSRDGMSFVVRNSFGQNWGFDGNFSIGYDQITPRQIFHAVVLERAGTKRNY